jgi:RNA-directed DNA polymerase
MAAKLVLEPILETDFCPISYGFRPGRRTQDAIEHVRRFINAPSFYEWVIEGDVENCFGSIHHGLLMAELRCRVSDKRVLRLIRQFLGAGIMDEHGFLAATPSGARQGAILSPLLATSLSRCLTATSRRPGRALLPGALAAQGPGPSQLPDDPLRG